MFQETVRSILNSGRYALTQSCRSSGSYKWAEVLSADAFSAFEDVGLDNPEAVAETGRRFRDTVLAMGGGMAPADVFRQFRGRDPSTDALLRHSDLLVPAAA